MLEPAGICHRGICPIDRLQQGDWLVGARLLRRWEVDSCWPRWHRLQQLVAADLFRRLDEMVIPKDPFANKLSVEDARRARFVRPELAAEVEFRSWTGEGLIRHASFRGLCEDKLAEEVVLESKETPGQRSPQQERITYARTYERRASRDHDGHQHRHFRCDAVFCHDLLAAQTTRNR